MSTNADKSEMTTINDNQMNDDTTPTPRTDAIQFQPKPISLSIENEMLRALSRQLERELAEKTNEVAEIRAALGDDGRRTHKEVIEFASKASQWREWKQKYIDLKNAHIAEGQDPAGTIWEHADKLQKELKTSQSEVARLREKVERQAERIRYLEGATNHACGTPLSRATNEVARLREQLTRVIEIAEKFRFYTKSYEWLSMKDELDKIKTEHEARLTLAPEEPVAVNPELTNPVVAQKTEDMSNNKWRELGPDEVIQEGDEIQWPYKDWQTAKSSIGYKVGYWDGLVKARTRRPLPKQEEMPLETPLDLDIEEIEAVASHPVSQRVDFYTRQLAMRSAHALRYLRDEIQKLKTETHYHHESYCRKCKEPMNPQTPDNEVARLRIERSIGLIKERIKKDKERK
jgi:hypothetical protein